MTRAQSFKLFLKHFSHEQFPLTFSDDTIHYFDQKNRALSLEHIQQFIKQGDSDEEDEYTEYIACNIIPKTENFYAIVYWKGSLLSYDYILATYNTNGILISKKVIAGIRSNGIDIHKSVATIEEDWGITIVAGSQIKSEEIYDPLKSKHTKLELLSSGEIIFSLQQ